MLGYSYCIFISSYGSIINELKMNRHLYKFIFTMVNYIITFIVKTYISLYKYSVYKVYIVILHNYIKFTL